jgi:recombination protein RecA
MGKTEEGDYKFFAKQLTKNMDGVNAFNASQLTDPEPNKSGSFALDFDLGIAFPTGGIIEVYGGEGSYKTTLALEVLGQALQAGKKGLFVNAEHSLTRTHLMNIQSIAPFLDMEDSPLLIVDPTTGEEALEAVKSFGEQFPGSVVVLDSVDACVPEGVLANKIGDLKVGNLPRLMSDAMRKLKNVQNGTTFILINQIREKIGVMFGDPRETSGGRALKFYAHQRIELLKPGKAQMIHVDGDLIGVIARYKIIKNKLQPAGQDGSFPIIFQKGIFREQELIESCMKFGILGMGGSGGKQVKLPSLDKETGELKKEKGEVVTKMMSRFNGARKLILDTKLYDYLVARYEEIVSPGYNVTVSLTDEVQNPGE